MALGKHPRLGLNTVVLMGHSTIRYFVMSEESSERPARPEEIDQMQIDPEVQT